MAKKHAWRNPSARKVAGRGKIAPPSRNRAETLHERGLLSYNAKDYEAAVAALIEAVALCPRIALWHTQLGVVLRKAGRLSDAVAAHQQAIALDPGLAVAHNNLGNALRESKDLIAAESALREACRLDSNYAEAYNNLGMLLAIQRRYAEAEAMCRRAVELKPNYLEAQRELGNLLLAKSDFAGAASCFETMWRAAPSDSLALMGLGAALEGLGRFDEADEYYHRVISQSPDLPSAHFAMGRRHEQRGDMVSAAASYRQALRLDPKLTTAYLSLSGLGKRGLTQDEKRRIFDLLASSDLPDDHRSNLLYALARAAEQECDWDYAFHWACSANEIDHRRTAFNEAENLAFVQQTMAVFQPARWTELPQGSSSERPIFIVGMPRSGTTLVEQIIASHPQTAAGGELVEMLNIVSELGQTMDSSRSYPECVFHLDEDKVRALAERYLARLDRVSTSAVRVTDKLPFNFRHLGLITALFPRARIIHCRRDPRDIAVSCYFIKFHRPISFACDLFEVGAYLRHYEALMAHWRRVLPLPMLDVQYEDLVTDLDRHVRRIIEFCGLPWDDRCLKFQEADRVVRTASAEQVRRPVYTSSIGRWRHYGKYLLPVYAELEKGFARGEQISRRVDAGLGN
jgi:tetratricopeptide (TPR) repeat protein